MQVPANRRRKLDQEDQELTVEEVQRELDDFDSLFEKKKKKIFK